MTAVPPDPSWLARLRAKVDERALPASEWLRTGWPRAVPLVLLGALPLAVAGPIRFVTGLGPCLALVLAVGLTVLGVLPFVRALRRPAGSKMEAIVANCVVLVVGAFAVWLLHNGDFGGLTSFIARDQMMAIDAATHVRQYHDFVARTPDVYEGFVSLYGFWDPVRRITGDLIIPARLTFSFGLFIVAAAPCIVTFSVLHKYRADRRAYLTGAVVCLLTALAVQYWLVLPLESFHHMGGFWAHLFGLIPLVSLWLVDALVRQRILRVAAILFIALLYRYTYGLNVPDLWAAVGLLLVAETLGRQLPMGTRIALGLAALAAFGVSLYSYEQIKPMFSVWGWILRHDPPRVLQGEVTALIAVCITAVWRPALASGSGIVRALRFPLVFGAVNAVLLVVVKHLAPSVHYYSQKYSFHAVVLTASALVVVASFWAAACATRLHGRTLGGALVVIALVAVSQQRLRKGFAVFQEGFHEHAFGGPPYHRPQPWYDPGALDRIHATLASEHEAFGGYLTAFWPMKCFMNALFDYGDRKDPQLTATPGHCVFWEAGLDPVRDADPDKRCSSYPRRWSPTGVSTLCTRCY